jgi:hypothetical protein
MPNFREESERNYSTTNMTATESEIRTGAMQRIADACEKMAKSHVQLIADAEFWKDQSRRNSEAVNRLRRSNAALRGVITKLKSKMGVTP